MRMKYLSKLVLCTSYDSARPTESSHNHCTSIIYGSLEFQAHLSQILLLNTTAESRAQYIFLWSVFKKHPYLPK